MIEVPLSQNKVALIDDEDSELILGRKWHACRRRHHWYACAYYKTPDGRESSQSMHRVLLNAPPGVMVDHLNNNGLDNRRSNIRLATNSQNQANRCTLSQNTSGYKGVCWNKDSQQWQAGIKCNGRSTHLGLFASLEEAAAAYDRAAIAAFGEYARINGV